MEFIKLDNAGDGEKYININWALMNQCNYECSYCHPDLNSGSIKALEYDVLVSFINRVFDYCESLGRKPYFELGGGEVTLLRWFKELVWDIHNRGGLVSIISNASKSLNWWRENVPALHGVYLSYHSEYVDDDKFVDVAKILADSPTTNLTVNVMMNPQRFEQCVSFANRLKNEVVCEISMQPLYHGFGHGGLTKRYEYTDIQDEIMKKFRGHSVNKNIPKPRGLVSVEMPNGEFIERSSFDLLVEQEINFVGWSCNAGIENIVITFKGDIYRAWCMQDGPIGTVFDKDFDFPIEPTLCKTKICQCGADICSTKIKNPISRHIENNIIMKTG
ncbi:radical SAM protein [Thaumasiovibrio subtropicus]|uniref:radical SAM protein n=1 Tax=Thaumasiovibrio subtropicus TaxID=1891207 RepID=UPI000B3563A8|nr:radical SAM protein [Thaumasiovibrio subtropicus]